MTEAPLIRILVIGLAPQPVDSSDAGLPPGMTRERIAAGIEAMQADLRARGWHARYCVVQPDDSAFATIAEALATSWDCVVVGGGIRLPPQRLVFFEQVVNAIHRGAPGVPIAFNTSPENTGDAAARWIDRA